MVKNISKKLPLQAIISGLSERQQHCINYVLKLFTYFNTVFVTQKRIGADIGLCRKTVNEYMGLFHRIGLIVKTRRFHPQFKLSNTYKLSETFTDLRDYLAFYFPSLKGWNGIPLYTEQSPRVTLRRTMPNIDSIFNGSLSKNSSSSPSFSSSSQDLFINPLPLSIQIVGAEYFNRASAYKYPNFHFFDSKPKPTCLEWAPSSMTEEENFKKFIEEADTVPDYIESPTLDEIKNLITIPELIEWLREQ